MDPMRAVVRHPTPVAQALLAFLGIAGEPLVARLPADPVASAELGHGVEVLAVIRVLADAEVYSAPGHRFPWPGLLHLVYESTRPNKRQTSDVSFGPPAW